jgi:hypothetical protein
MYTARHIKSQTGLVTSVNMFGGCHALDSRSRLQFPVLCRRSHMQNGVDLVSSGHGAMRGLVELDYSM